MWQDLFKIYQSVQSNSSDSRRTQRSETPAPQATQQRTMYLFAYLDDGSGKTMHSVPITDRLALLEIRQQQLEERLAELEAALEDALEDSEED